MIPDLMGEFVSLGPNLEARRRALGQHFLVSNEVADKMIEFARIRKTDTVLEIGTGTGVLTERIARIAKSVVSFEMDAKIFSSVKKQISRYGNVRLEFGDAFSTRTTTAFDLCVSSIPYSRSLEFVQWMALRSEIFRSCVVLVQREFAEKLLARPGSKNYRAVSVIAQSCFTIENLQKVQREAFAPSPSVSSCIIRLTPRSSVKYKSLTLERIALIKRIFSFRRKTVISTLKKMGLLSKFPKLNDENFRIKRVQQLSSSDFILIAEIVGI